MTDLEVELVGADRVRRSYKSDNLRNVSEMSEEDKLDFLLNQWRFDTHFLMNALMSNRFKGPQEDFFIQNVIWASRMLMERGEE